MSRYFTRSQSKYLQIEEAAVTAAPLTMACWCHLLDITDVHVLMGVQHSASTTALFEIAAKGQVGGDPVAATIKQGGTWGVADSTSGYSADTWHHVCGVFSAQNSRHVLLDGGSKGTDNTNLNPLSINRTSIGRRGTSSPSGYVDGFVAEAAIWNAALTDEEAVVLAAGYSPLFIRPQNLVFYVPLVRDNDDDIIGGRQLTAYGSPLVWVHPRIIYPAPVLYGKAGPPPAGNAIPMAATLYRRRRAG